METRDGRTARIICTDAKADDGACIIALISGYGGEEAYQFFPDGRAFSSKSSIEDCADLFIVTPEEELSKFEDAILRCIRYGLNAKSDENVVKITKEHAAELLSLAIDARAKGLSDGLMHSNLDTDSIPYHLIEFMCNLYTCQNWKEIEDTAELYVTRIKAAALKDLPRWEDIRNFAYSWTSEGKTFYNDTLGQLFHKGKKLFIGDLEKLPGFKED